jgi:hypothetical protein
MVIFQFPSNSGLHRISNLVILIWIAAAPTIVSASFSTSSYSQNQDKTNEIACSQVVRSVGFSIVENAKIQHDDVSFLCVVDPNEEASSKLSIQRGTWLSLSNIGPDFEDSWKTANKRGMTRLVVRGGKVKGSVLEVDSLSMSEDTDYPLSSVQERKSIILASGDTQTTSSRDGIDANEDHSVPIDDGILQNLNSTTAIFKAMHFKQSMEWKSPLEGQQKTSDGRSNGRNLAINQTGEKTAIVFRVTTSNNGSPSNSANEVSNGVFGTSGDSVTLTSMYSACSYNLLNIAPAVVDGTSAPGVIDVTVVTTGTTYDIENEIRINYDGILQNIDHVLIHVVCVLKNYSFYVMNCKLCTNK